MKLRPKDIAPASKDSYETSASELTQVSIPRRASKIESQISMAVAMSRAISAKASRALVMVALVVLLISALMECHFIKRTQYHEQGVHGPKSYKFGYTTGDHKNPQERHEVSDGYGHVKGWYSFVDATGKHQIVHYEAHPKYGFKVLHDHNQKAYNTGKRHYNS